MNREWRRTGLLAALAAVLLVLAMVTAPRNPVPGEFVDRGEPFFREFTDPNAATSLEVIDWDATSGAAMPFKVVNAGGRWTIPSHHDYPADGKDRLARTAAALIELRKEDVRSGSASDHVACGVVDPLDEAAPGVEGRGRRVTVKGPNDAVLADVIVGSPVEGREGYRFVRIPGQKRIYVARLGDEISSKFGDWIEKDLLQAQRDDFTRIVIRDYSIDELTGMVKERDTIALAKDGGTWRLGGRATDSTALGALLGALDDLEIVGVRPKPAGLTQSLTRSGAGITITYEDMMSLRSRGYYFAMDGRLLSNEGELQAVTRDGVIYTLRFGEVVYGTGAAVTAGAEDGGAAADSMAEGASRAASGAAENRYLFITTEAGGAEAGGDAARGRSLSAELNRRFAGWYYVIPASSFERLHVTRRQLAR